MIETGRGLKVGRRRGLGPKWVETAGSVRVSVLFFSFLSIRNINKYIRSDQQITVLLKLRLLAETYGFRQDGVSPKSEILPKLY